jgi:hypothetical protein
VYTDVRGRKWPYTEAIFAGNFWWANAGYIASLPPLEVSLKEADRGEAETWLGRGKPKVYDLSPGFMDFENLGLTLEEIAEYPDDCIKTTYRPVTVQTKI